MDAIYGYIYQGFSSWFRLASVFNCFDEGEFGMVVKLMTVLGDVVTCWYYIWVCYIWSMVIKAYVGCCFYFTDILLDFASSAFQ